MDNDKCKILIQLYGSKKLLWNSKLTTYHNKLLREAAWKDISETMKLPVSVLKNKMTSLLAAHRREKSRMRKSMITGSGRGSIYISKWFAFDYFSFMADKDVPSSTSDTVETRTENEDSAIKSINLHETSTPLALDSTPVSQNKAIITETTLPTRRKKRCQNTVSNSSQDKMLEETVKILKENISIKYQDPYYIFGQYIASELRKYDNYTLTQVKRAISNVLFEADLGKYSYSCYTDATSQQQSPDNSSHNNAAGSPHSNSES